MMQQLANFIVDHDPMMILRRHRHGALHPVGVEQMTLPTPSTKKTSPVPLR